MRYSFDPAKAVANLLKHGVAFEAVEDFDWATAVVRADTRQAEKRLVAIGRIGAGMHAQVYSIERRVVRVISLCPASRKEILVYVAAQDASA